VAPDEAACLVTDASVDGVIPTGQEQRRVLDASLLEGGAERLGFVRFHDGFAFVMDVNRGDLAGFELAGVSSCGGFVAERLLGKALALPL
jgi:hypothetical protein